MLSQPVLIITFAFRTNITIRSPHFINVFPAVFINYIFYFKTIKVIIYGFIVVKISIENSFVILSSVLSFYNER